MAILNYNDWNLNESVAYISGVSNLEIVAATLIGEAGGEIKDGMKAVKNVLVNREKKRGKGVAAEALRPKQFSMWNSATCTPVAVPAKNYDKGEGYDTAAEFNISKIKAIIASNKSHAKWSTALALAKTTIPDITKGATLYYAARGTNKVSPPGWTSRWTPTVKIGNHDFGKSA